MLFSTRLLKGIAAVATVIVAQAAGATAQYNNVDEFGVPINADGTIIPEQGIKEIAKAEFVEFLDSKSESLLIQFYDTDIDESKAAMEEYEVFAEKAAARYPDLVVRKVNYKKDNYLTARLLLMQIPELRLLIKGEDGQWSAYGPEMEDFSAEELFEYLDNQQWLLDPPIGDARQAYCSPFNFCGRTLAWIADSASFLEDIVPLPKWLAIVIIPAVITFAGRFIIEAMYGAEEVVRDSIRSLSGKDKKKKKVKVVKEEATEEAGAAKDKNESKKTQ